MAVLVLDEAKPMRLLEGSDFVELVSILDCQVVQTSKINRLLRIEVTVDFGILGCLLTYETSFGPCRRVDKLG